LARQSRLALFKAGFNGHTGAIRQVQPIGGNMAWAIGEWGITGTGPNGAKLQNGGKLGGVYEQDGGDWKIVIMTVNIKPPPEPATGSTTQ
jgi:ketosteroid isomerase-like protein